MRSTREQVAVVVQASGVSPSTTTRRGRSPQRSPAGSSQKLATTDGPRNCTSPTPHGVRPRDADLGGPRTASRLPPGLRRLPTLNVVCEPAHLGEPVPLVHGGSERPLDVRDHVYEPCPRLRRGRSRDGGRMSVNRGPPGRGPRTSSAHPRGWSSPVSRHPRERGRWVESAPSLRGWLLPGERRDHHLLAQDVRGMAPLRG